MPKTVYGNPNDDAAHAVAAQILGEASKRRAFQQLEPETVANALMHFLARMMVNLYHHDPQQIADRVLAWAIEEAEAMKNATEVIDGQHRH